MKFRKIKSFLKKNKKKLIHLLTIFVIIYISVNIFANYLNQPSYAGPKNTISVNNTLDTNIYFNNIVGEESVLDVIVDQIDSAEEKIEIAIFSFNSKKIKDSIERAADRGVAVDLISDLSNSNQHDLFIGDLKNKINIHYAGDYDPEESINTRYMHNKFVITDRGNEKQKLTTGSVNFSVLGEKYNQSFILETEDDSIIKVYGDEFDLIKSGTYGNRKVFNRNYNPWAARINYEDSFLDIWFSPGYSTHSIKHEIIKHISEADSSIKIMMWYFTDMQIANSVIERAEEGVAIDIIVESKASNNKDSVVPYLKEVKQSKNLDNLNIILDTKLSGEVKEKVPEGFKPYIHHHSVVVDDDILIFGSSNWSLWGFYYNDENNLITDNKYIINKYNETFDYFLKLLK